MNLTFSHFVEAKRRGAGWGSQGPGEIGGERGLYLALEDLIADATNTPKSNIGSGKERPYRKWDTGMEGLDPGTAKDASPCGPVRKDWTLVL